MASPPSSAFAAFATALAALATVLIFLLSGCLLYCLAAAFVAGMVFEAPVALMPAT